MTLAVWLQQHWYAQRRPPPALWFLLPLHALFVLLSGLRRLAYRHGLLTTVHLHVPVIVVGNIVAGGTGKTPLVIWLAQAMRARGWHPGIISRGYRSTTANPHPVTNTSEASGVGDEPLLLAGKSGAPVWIGADRAATGRALLASHPEVNVLIADDGLQHYRLARQAELVVFDGRASGNGWRLPLGPLREPLCRLQKISALVFNSTDADMQILSASGPVPHFAMRLLPQSFYRLGQPEITCTAAALQGRCLHAVAGLGAPRRFFDTLRSLGLAFAAHPFPDHHAYTANDLDFGQESVVLMTEKDAVKCTGLASREIWVLPVRAEVPTELLDLLLEKIDGRKIA